MAMNPRRPGDTAAPRPRRNTQSGVRRVYEHFKPVSEWQQDEHSDIVLVYLPGFMKEQLKVSTEGRNMIRVTGERLVAGNKWNRFSEYYQVPDHSEITSIRAKYEGGVLRISMPRKSVTSGKSDAKVEKRTPQEAPIPPSQKPPTTPTTVDSQKPKTSSDVQPKPQAQAPGQVNVPLKVDPAIGPREETDEEASESPVRPKLIADLKVEMGKDIQEKDKKSISETKAKPVTTERTGDGTKKIAEEEVKSVKKREELKTEHATVIKNIVDKKKVEKDKENRESKGKENLDQVAPAADQGTLRLDNYKKALKELAGLNEERQLLVNMGVAVLVIMSLGTYISYTLGSGKTKH